MLFFHHLLILLSRSVSNYWVSVNCSSSRNWARTINHSLHIQLPMVACKRFARESTIREIRSIYLHAVGTAAWLFWSGKLCIPFFFSLSSVHKSKTAAQLGMSLFYLLLMWPCLQCWCLVWWTFSIIAHGPGVVIFLYNYDLHFSGRKYMSCRTVLVWGVMLVVSFRVLCLCG